MQSDRARRSRLWAAIGICALAPSYLLATGEAGRSTPRRRVTHPPTLAETLGAAARRAPAPSSGVSISIAELDTGAPVFEKNAATPETIASVTKMFSTAAALHFLGPDYKFKTTLWRRGDVQDGMLVGSLLVVGGGDPNISGRFYDDNYNAVFDKWAEGLVKQGIQRVSGDLILNASFFDSTGRNPEWRGGQEARWYQAPSSALSFNDNVVTVSVRPGLKAGGPAAVTIEPECDVLRTVGGARTVRRGRPRLGVQKSYGSGDVSVWGTMPSRGAWWSAPIAIDDPPAFFGSALRHRIQNAGITVLGQTVQQDVKPDNAWTLVAETESGLLPSIAVTNKRSQGFYAEQIFKTLGAVKGGVGSWATAIAAQKEFFAALGLDPASYDLHDGSGLSPQNRVAAGDIVRFLRAMYAQPYGQAWKATLAVSGDPEGTLRHRMTDAMMEGRVQAKTGSISGVSTLSGYVTASSGKTYVFSILLNGGRVYDTNGHAYQDRILRALVKAG
ncbi:MAG TPA: D-alanyl-D-alanine carboxypeptidase/D-alanyl-D-alanine-endopeptidase [Thermoanaerobaculia bacterium]|nr:D-alanyl-D-alanine carboxypeptidase/D-alanyl-D-alanine-endopeptidase [Thermoanaerobaculia bacterium]